jgi:hypothetical protein
MLAHVMSDKLQFVAGVALVETHDKLKLVGHFLRSMTHETPVHCFTNTIQS